MAEDAPIFHYKDAAGRDVLTNDPHDLPANAEIVDTSAPPSKAAAPIAVHAPAVPVFHVDTTSALVGGGVGFAAGFVVAATIARRTQLSSPTVFRMFMRVAAAMAAIVVIGALYLGFAMRTAGLSEGVVATPADPLDQAKQAAAAANRATRAQERALEQATRN